MKRFLVWLVVSSVVAAGVAVIAVFPTRTYLGQRKDLTEAKERVAVLAAQNKELAARADRLNRDDEIERLAREQYSLVKPGEEAYAILPAPATTTTTVAPATRRAAKARPTSPSLWDRLKFWD